MQFTVSMPSLEGSDQTEVTKGSVIFPDESHRMKKQKNYLDQEVLRSTRGHPPERYGKVCTLSALHSNASGQAWYKHSYFLQYEHLI